MKKNHCTNCRNYLTLDSITNQNLGFCSRFKKNANSNDISCIAFDDAKKIEKYHRNKKKAIQLDLYNEFDKFPEKTIDDKIHDLEVLENYFESGKWLPTN